VETETNKDALHCSTLQCQFFKRHGYHFRRTSLHKRE